MGFCFSEESKTPTSPWTENSLGGGVVCPFMSAWPWDDVFMVSMEWTNSFPLLLWFALPFTRGTKNEKLIEKTVYGI